MICISLPLHKKRNAKRLSGQFPRNHKLDNFQFPELVSFQRRREAGSSIMCGWLGVYLLSLAPTCVSCSFLFTTVDRGKEGIDDSFSSENREISHLLRCHVQRGRTSYAIIGYSHDDLALGFLFHEQHSYYMRFATKLNRYVWFVAPTPEQLRALLTWRKEASPLDT